MALMQWSALFETGIPVVDEQHQHLVNLVNAAAPTLANDQTEANAVENGKLLDALTEYAIYHFRTEGELFHQHGLDGRHVEEHLKAHGDFAQTVATMRSLFEDRQTINGNDLLAFLANWLVFHILGEDRDMARQIQAISAGISPAEAYDTLTASKDPSRQALTDALVDLYGLLTRQNQQLLENNIALYQHQKSLEQTVDRRTRELAHALQAAEAANLAKSAFIANLSHEVRTPMNTIVGLTWKLQETLIEPGQRERLQQISQATQQLLALINDLIDISRIESDQLSIEPLDFDLRQVIDHVVADHSGPAAKKGLKLTTVLPPHLPALLNGDPVRLGQILANLLSNAIKFTHEGSISLSVQLLPCVDTPGRMYLDCTVDDSGIGISAEKTALLFRPFEQLDTSTRRRAGGTGLGLAICKRLTEMMGGNIGVESTPGQGSRFWFRVPLGIVVSATSATTEEGQQAAATRVRIDWPTVVNTLQHLQALLADDDIQSINVWRETGKPLYPVLGERYLHLDGEINAYNFESALAIVEQAIRTLPDGASKYLKN